MVTQCCEHSGCCWIIHFLFLCWVWFFETASCLLKLASNLLYSPGWHWTHSNLLLQPAIPECWNYRCVSSYHHIRLVNGSQTVKIWGCSWMEEHVVSVHKALGSVSGAHTHLHVCTRDRNIVCPTASSKEEEGWGVAVQASRSMNHRLVKTKRSGPPLFLFLCILWALMTMKWKALLSDPKEEEGSLQWKEMYAIKVVSLLQRGDIKYTRIKDRNKIYWYIMIHGLIDCNTGNGNQGHLHLSYSLSQPFLNFVTVCC